MITKIKGGRLVLEDKTVEGKNIYIKDGRITAITADDTDFDKEIDAEGNFVSAGFVDIHVHGGGGFDFMDGGEDAIIGASDMHLKHGTTSIMPTSLASKHETLIDFLGDLKSVMDGGKASARILGAHLEGPYFADSQRGAQPPEYIKAPVEEEYTEVIKKYGDIVKRWSFAPELLGADKFAKTLIENNIRPSFAHTEATYDEVKPIYDLGCNMMTHLYSGMSSITRKNGYRSLGVVECAYLLDGIVAEIIADGKHLPKELLKLIIKQLGTDNVVLVTDAMRGAGMGSGESLLGRIGEGLPCIIEDGIAKTMDRQSFAGSVATSDRLVRTMVKEAGCTVNDAVKMMTKNPADAVKRFDIGRLEVGCFGDIVIFDDDINIKNVILNGELVK